MIRNLHNGGVKCALCGSRTVYKSKSRGFKCMNKKCESHKYNRLNYQAKRNIWLNIAKGNLFEVRWENKIMKKVTTIVMTAALTIFMNVSVFANVNYALLNEWSKQPEKIQYALARDGTTINVVPALPVTYMNETWAVTNTYCYPGTKYILKTDVLLLPDHEDCLTHEVGHCVSHQDRTAFFWVENPYWINIYMQEAHKQTIYPQGWDNAYEYFATSYEEYLRFPKYMKQLQPSTYNYMSVVFSYK